MKTRIALIALALLAVAFIPLTAAQPECIDARPWSDICQGDIGGAVCYMADCGSIVQPAGPSPIAPPEVNCIQAIPYSYLCSGNVGAFVCYFVAGCTITRDPVLP